MANSNNDETAHRILICVDESELAERAFDYYAERLHKQGNEVIVMHVSDMVRLPAYHLMQVVNNDDIKKQAEHIQCRSTGIVEKFKSKCEQHRISAKVISVSGDNGIGRTIVEHVERFSISLIVMASRGLGKIQGALLGSVSTYVIHHSRAPIVVCPPPRKKK